MKQFLTSAAAAALVSLAASTANATILTFDIDNAQSNTVLPMDQVYGDNVSALVQGGATYGVGAEGFTPDVTVGYFRSGGQATGLTRWTTDYGDLVNILENESDGDTLLQVVLTAASGFSTTLYGFDLGGWPNSDYTIAGVSVVADGTTVFSQSNVLVQGDISGPRHTAFSFTGFTGQVIALNIDLTGLGGASDNIGLDNVRFGQSRDNVGAIPEPSTWAIMILGFGAAGAAIRRRRVADVA